jgi:predicted transcriptional regulator
VDRNLRILEQENIIRTKRIGNVRIIRLNFENPKTDSLLRALQLLDRPTSTFTKKG